MREARSEVASVGAGRQHQRFVLVVESVEHGVDERHRVDRGFDHLKSNAESGEIRHGPGGIGTDDERATARLTDRLVGSSGGNTVSNGDHGDHDDDRLRPSPRGTPTESVSVTRFACARNGSLR